MQAEVKDAYWKIFDTSDLASGPGPKLAEIIDNRTRDMAGRYSATYPAAMKCLTTDREGLTAYLRFPAEHHNRVRHSNFMERLNKEIKRRTDVVGVFPNPAALLRLAGAVLVEAHDEWQVSERRYLSEGSMALLDIPPAEPKEVATPALLTA
jgi:transposase-like protein